MEHVADVESEWGVAPLTLGQEQFEADIAVLTLDVTITYTQREGVPTTSSFASDVAYRSASGSLSHVRGVETLSKGKNKATFDWRGNGLLWLITSHWEVIGLGRWEGYEWAVTCELDLTADFSLLQNSVHACWARPVCQSVGQRTCQ